MARDSFTLSLFDHIVDANKKVEPITAAAPVTTAHVAGEETCRDEICKEWLTCRWGDACMDDHQINLECCCFKDEPHRIPLDALSRDERKVASAGLPLVKYFREQKTIWVSCAELANGWEKLPEFATYAQAERKLKALKEQGHIESDRDGKIVMSGWMIANALRANGFEFYRCYGLEDYQTGCCIKIGSKNWSNLAKYDTPEELRAAWDDLMNQPSALEG
ncbi:MAG: hypothetical protein HGB26_01460 [Desulfobulbaceae bacterium]|nr:hypothetical protein [Desulfobulbaceae bacterium]